MHRKQPTPFRLASLGSSSPFRVCLWKPSWTSILSPHDVGERWLGEAETEKG
jgi:hypothetical protein